MNKKLRIVIVRSNGIDPDSRVEKEANSLAKAGYDVTLIAWNRDENFSIRYDYKQLSETKVKRISFGAKAEFGAGMKSLRPYLSFQRRLFGWLVKNKNNYDVCHFCDFDTAFTGSNACRMLRKPYVFDIFDYLSTDAKTAFQKSVKRAEDNIINHANATIICTEKRKEQIKDAKPRRLIVIHNTPDNYPSLRREKGISLRGEKSSVKIAYVGILQDHRLLKELVEVVSKMNDVELHIGGFGKYEEYMKAADEKYSSIFFYGKLQYADTLELEKSCDIMTAIYDPMIGNHKYAAPNKFYEALMLGKPLIMVKGTGMSEVVEENKIGVLIDYSKAGVREGIEKLVNRENEWDSISVKMENMYEERYSWNIMEKRLLMLYEGIG